MSGSSSNHNREQKRERERDDNSGRYVESLTEEAILAVFRDRKDPYEPLTAREIGEVLGFDRRTVDTRLRQMAEQDRVMTKKLGARARAWWLPDTSDAPPSAEASGGSTTSDETPEQQLKRLSKALGEPITVGGRVFEDGDAHGLSGTEPDSDDANTDTDTSIGTDRDRKGRDGRHGDDRDG